MYGRKWALRGEILRFYLGNLELKWVKIETVNLRQLIPLERLVDTLYLLNLSSMATLQLWESNMTASPGLMLFSLLLLLHLSVSQSTPGYIEIDEVVSWDSESQSNKILQAR